jgi:cytochrome b6-f complex iron-sulfur subunit
MSIESSVSRRTLLAAGAGGVGATVIGACSSSSGGSGDKAAAKSDATTAAAAGAGSSSAAAPLATLADIPVGSAVSVTLPDGKPGIVSRPTATTAACFSAICTHQGCTVKPAKTTLNCPCHGSKYNASTGAVLGGPAPAPLPKVAVTVSDGKVVPA